MAVRFRNALKNFAASSNSALACLGHAMSSRIFFCCRVDAATNGLPKRLPDSVSSQARPVRIRSRLSISSIMTKSMNSGTPASLALGPRLSAGSVRSASTVTVANSPGVKKVGV